MTDQPRVIHQGRHEIGEGPLWHDGIGRLFWFSILEGRLLSCAADGADPREWRLGERASAAGIIDDATLLIATETGLWRLDLAAGTKTLVVALEADNPRTRSNDGRVAPDGSFWIGTMGLDHTDGAGAIYRFVPEGDGGRVEVVQRNVTIPNSICFAPDGRTAYWCDTKEGVIRRLPLGTDGAPAGDSAVHVDLRKEGLNPDGSVTDREGCLWNAQWGAHRVARYDPDGRFMEAVSFPVAQVSCPAFGGLDMTTLFATTAHEGLSPDRREADAGNTFAIETGARGRPEARVALSGRRA